MPFLEELKIRTAVYFDGFNFYYSSVKHTPYKWTDLKKLCEEVLLPHHEIVQVKYFTAQVSGTKGDPQKPSRQSTYLRALEAHIDCFSAHMGNFMSHEKKRPLVDTGKLVNVVLTEEKGSDVNLAVHLLNDAWEDTYDCAVVVSNDSDLAEAIKLARRKDKVMGVLTSRNRPTAKLFKECDFHRRITKTHLKKSALPDKIPGTNLFKPTAW